MSDTQKKKRMVYSFALKKNDSPFVQEFIENQSNFSETLRYLIYKYVAENGTDDISYKFYELLFNNAGSSSNLSYSSDGSASDIDSIGSDTISSVAESSVTTDVTDDVDDFNLDDDIPDCYK